MNWLLRAAQWVRNPPSAGRVKLVLAVIALGILIVTLEWAGWWPDWARVDKGGPRLPR